MLNKTVLNYIIEEPRTGYYGTEILDYSDYSMFGGKNSPRVGKTAMPIIVDGEIEGIMVWEEAINVNFAKRIIPYSFTSH
jgi:hypothetical protein